MRRVRQAGVAACVRSCLLLGFAFLPSCLTLALWEGDRATVEEHTAVTLAIASADDGALAVYVPVEALPAEWREAGVPLQEWLALRPVAEATTLRAWRDAGAAPVAAHCTVTFGDIAFPDPTSARLQVEGLDTSCRTEWSAGPGRDAVPVGGTVNSFRSEQATTWWRGLLTPFAFVTDVALLPFELLFGYLWPAC